MSGGSDSVAMLHCLIEAAKPRRWRLHVAHVHHHLRAEADEDARFVESLAEREGLSFTLLELDDHELKQREGASTSFEARLREERLRLLRGEALRLGARALALGHTADDAAETFLLMALRGSGPRGLGSLRATREQNRLFVVRPVMSKSKAELEEQLCRRRQTWRVDPSNASLEMRRNRLRHSIMPTLDDIEPAARRLLARSAEICGEESELIESIAEDHAKHLVLSRLPGSMLVNAEKLAELPLALRKIVIRHFWMNTLRAKSEAEFVYLPPSRELTESLARNLERVTGERASFGPSQGVCAWCGCGDLLFCAAEDDPARALAEHMKELNRVMLLDEDRQPIPVLNSTQRYTPGKYEVSLPGGQGVLELQVMPVERLDVEWKSAEFASHCAAAIDSRAVRRDLYLRAADPHERIPIGEGRSKEVGEALQEARVPAELRARTATLADDRGTLWIPAVRRAATGFVTQRTELVIVARWNRE